MRKNDEYLVQQALQLLKADPRIVLATVGDTPDSVIEHLEEEGYRIQELDYYLDYYDTAPEMPEAPQAECYSSEENYAEAVKRYEAALARFTEQTRQLEFGVTEGRVRKYAIIGMFDVEIRYEDVPEEERVGDNPLVAVGLQRPLAQPKEVPYLLAGEVGLRIEM